ncbi:hypothetical protein Tco_1184267 [Tanacetum coccineum]
MNQNFYNSNSSDFDQFQPSQYSDEAILLQEQAVEEKQELLAEEHAANPSEPSPVSYFYNADYDNISTPSTTYTIHLTKRTLFPNEVKRIQQILERTSFDAITPDFSITDSLSMGDEHLSTILETESDKLIKFSVKNLVPTPSESEDLSNIESECNVPVCDDFTTFSNLLFDADNDFSSSDDESFFDEDVPKENFKIFSNPLSDEEIISTKIDPHHFNAESDLIESLLNRDTLIISSPKFDSLLEEFSGDILFLEELLSNDSPSLPENESFHFDVPSSPRPPAKPPDDDDVYFDIEPDTGVFTKVVDDISDNSTRELYVHVPNVLPNLPTLSPMFDTLLPFSYENDDKVFNPRILASNL